MKIKNILVSQPQPRTDKSPYFDLANNNNVKVDFRTFIEVQGVDTREFRQQKINLADFQSVIFTSRTAIDHFFRIAEQIRYTVPDEMKYFCSSESVALYLQKYIQYRKRKIFFGNRSIEDLLTTFKKHKSDNYLLPLSDKHKDAVPNFLDKNKIKYKKAILYRTVSSNLSDLKDLKYDVLVFYSPSGITSLFDNFPDYQQNNTLIASFGTATAAAVKKAGLRLDIQAPSPKAPSMTMALEQHLKENNSNTKK